MRNDNYGLVHYDFEPDNIFYDQDKTEYCYSEEIETLLSIMHRYIDLFSYARLIRSVEESFTAEPDWLLGLRKKLNKVIEKCQLNVFP